MVMDASLDKAPALRTNGLSPEATMTTPSHASSSFFDSALHSGNISRASTIPISVDHLEQLLRSCAEALAKARPTDSSLNGARSAPIDTHELSLGHQPPYNLDQKPSIDVSEKRIHVLEYYDLHTSKESHSEDENDWDQAKVKWKRVLDDVGDIWEAEFPSCRHAADHPAHSKCHPLAVSELRKECQRELLLARLNLEHDTGSIKDAKPFLPWLSVIAYKIDQIDSLTNSFSRFLFRSQLGPHEVKKRPNLLVQILRFFYEGPAHYLARRDEFLIGSLLAFCYERDSLTRPKSPSDPLLDSNFRHVVYSLWILNIIQTPRYSFTYTSTIVQQRLPAVGSYVLDMLPLDAVARTVDEIEYSMQQRQPDLPAATGENVRCSDLHLAALKNIGGLRIVWSSCDQDHLFLDQENHVLRLSFFNKVLVTEFYRYMPMLGRNDLARTWSLLLGYRKSQNDSSELDNIPLPPELFAYNIYFRRRRLRILHRLQDNRSTSGVLSFLLSSRAIPDVQDKLNIHMQPMPYSVPYDYFGKYEQRIRILRHYMDTRKPTGLRILFHDRRDSLNFYTFWAVLIFGGVSMLLAGIGVVLGVAQTVAAFRQLDQIS